MLLRAALSEVHQIDELVAVAGLLLQGLGALGLDLHELLLLLHAVLLNLLEILDLSLVLLIGLLDVLLLGIQGGDPGEPEDVHLEFAFADLADDVLGQGVTVLDHTIIDLGEAILALVLLGLRDEFRLLLGEGPLLHRAILARLAEAKGALHFCSVGLQAAEACLGVEKASV